MRLTPAGGGVVYVEAKRFGRVKELEQARNRLDPVLTPGELGLGGMAVDRTPEEQQAINYAFQNGGRWAILTNFEKLRLFNARRDWLVLSFENPAAYLSEFDLLWQLSYERIGRGGLDELSEQRHRGDVDTAYLTFISEWRERLARDIVANRAANPWAFDGDGRIRVAELRAVVQRILDRLVVVRFAEDHLVVRPGTLQSIHDLRQLTPYTFTLSEFYARLYRVFDDRHNSGLFTYGRADEAVISDEALAGLTRKLYEARYRAMSADIMGNTYEQYLGQALAQRGETVVTADNLETRKKQGSYYTPQVIVRYLVDNSLGRYLYGTADGRAGGEPLPDEPRKTAGDIRGLRLIDPACGSGSFLIYAYELLAGFYRSEIARLTAERDAGLNELIAAGVTTPFDLQLQLAPWRAQLERLQDYPTFILENHLYGVDLDPQAAEIATVNLIMRAMADMPGKDRRLPLILNQNVKVGNSLIGAGPGDPRLNDHAESLVELRRLRLALAAESENDPAHPAPARIAGLAAGVNAALDEGLVGALHDPARHRPFNWAVEFPEVFAGEDGRPLGEAGGFDVVVGNPPWEILKPEIREYYAQFDDRIESKLNRAQVEARIAELDAADLAIPAGWRALVERIEASGRYFRQSTDYTRQGRGDTATHKLFIERGYSLLERRGRLAFVVPSGIYTDLGTKALREMLLEEGQVEYLFNFSNEKFFFKDVHHSFKFTLLGAQRGVAADGFRATFRFNPRVAVAPDKLASFLAEPSNLVYVSLDSLRRFSPDSLSVMEFQTQRDADVTDRLYNDHPLAGENREGDWIIRFNREFDMTNDRHLFNTHGGPVPVYNGRMIHQFDSQFAPHEFWVSEARVKEISPATWEQVQAARLGFRRIARTTDSRTLIAAIVPPRSLCDSVALVEDGGNARDAITLYLSALFNSLALDYVLRQKIATTVNMFYLYQLPVPRLAPGHPLFDAIVPRAARLTCTRPEFAGLWQEVMGEEWTAAGGATDPAERQALRDELDALVAHLYGLSRDDFAHILGAFPLVFPAMPAGEARKAGLLGVYDRLVERE